MAVLPILWAPDPRLKTKCTPVERIDDGVRQLIDDMIDTMYDADGIGLAAPQVGVMQRIVVIDPVRQENKPAPICMINPVIVEQSGELVAHEEGCLSLPGHFAEVVRPARVRIRYEDRDGASRELEGEEMIAVCAQHELDHLDGILFVDHLSSLKRNIILRKMVKAKKDRRRNRPR